MKKKIILRSALGFPIGIAIGYLINILQSLIWANGYYSPCAPELVSAMGNEINAVLLQTLLCGLLGVSFAGCSVIWQIEQWSIVKQTGINFLIVTAVMMPIAYFSYWMEHTMAGFLSYLIIFALIFAAIWLILFFTGKHHVHRMNQVLHKMKD